MQDNWKVLAEQKRLAIHRSIPQEWLLEHIPQAEEEPNVNQYLDVRCSAEEAEILNSSIISLAEKIREGKLTSLKVTKVFCKRASQVHQLTNCCSEIFFHQALERAEFLDNFFSKNGEVIGPLHGIPISVKDQVNIVGLDSAIGYIGKLNHPKAKDDESVIAKILIDLGAILYVKTTTPMAMLAPETNSNIYGVTINAINRKVTCAGSSGGEGALIGGKGSLLGFGTDIGGSIRLPASVQGLYGLKPSSNRLPYCNLENSSANAPNHCSVIGPMAANLKDLKYVTELILKSKPWLYDPKCPPIPWDTVKLRDSLSFGLIDVTRYSYVDPPIRRAMKLVKECLLGNGHDVIDFIPPTSLLELADLSSKFILAGGSEEIVNECSKSGEPIIKELFGEDGDKCLPEKVDLLKYYEYSGLKYDEQKKFRSYWSSTSNLTKTGRPVDGLIIPVNTWSAMKPGDSNLFSLFCTQAFNLLDTSVVTVPVTKARKDLDPLDLSYIPKSKEDEIRWRYYDPELCHSTPATIQVVASQYEEEKAIALAEILDSCLKKR